MAKGKPIPFDQMEELQRAASIRDLERLAKEFGVSRKYAFVVRRQASPRSKRVGRFYEMPVPKPIYREAATYADADAGSPVGLRYRPIPGERALIARIAAGDE
jgi:hypothetical protein